MSNILTKADPTKLVRKAGQTVFKNLKGILFHNSTNKDASNSTNIQRFEDLYCDPIKPMFTRFSI